MSSGLEKLTITPFSKTRQNRDYTRLGEIRVLFNPETYTISKSVAWNPPQSATGSPIATQSKLNAPVIAFGGGGSRQLSLELFFDITSPSDRLTRQVEDVREETNKIVRLTRIEKEEAQPPVCRVAWGTAPTYSDFPFTGVVSALTQRFTQFKPDGKPVRATLSVTFLEFLDPDLDKRLTDPEMTSWVVKAGDSLSRIAYAMYNDPRLWRAIAEANSIDDPRHLDREIGRRLTIPKLR
jgi:nucleoid-associated protein YgaU